ncbi:MAG: YhdP family protein [Burkholderiaceae bacterium]
MPSTLPPLDEALPPRGMGRSDAAAADRAVDAAQNRRRRWLLRLLLWPVLLLWTLLALAWLALHWLILPHIEEWRAPIELRASAALGLPVQIGHIAVRSSGWVPALELRDVKLLDAQQRTALHLPRVAVAISPQSLLDLEVNFDQLLIEGAELDVRRSADGQIFVAGLALGGGAGEGRAGADWFLSQHEFAIRGGTLRWTDEQRNAPTLALTDVQFVMRNGLLTHDVRLDATPPPEWGERFSLTGRFTQPLMAPSSQWQRWSGRAYAELPRANLSPLRRHVALPFELNEGSGALRAWFELREGTLQAATFDVALNQLGLRLGSQVEELRIEQLRGRIDAQRDANGGSVSLERFSFVTTDGTHWPGGAVKLKWRQREGESPSGGEFSAQSLDLALLAQIASRVPLGAALHQLLAELEPEGSLSDLSARWDGPFDAPTRYQVNGQVSALAFAARSADEPDRVGRPGLRNASLSLAANENGGTARLAVRDGWLDLPGLFEEPRVQLDRLNADLEWRIAAAKVTLIVKKATLANADAIGEFEAKWNTGPGAQAFGRGGRWPGQIELTGQLGAGLAARAARYLPLGIPESTRRYVERAVKGGQLRRLDVRVKGDLWDFPYFDPATSGEFRLAATADDVSFAFLPSAPATPTEAAFVSPWPELARVSGELVIDRASLEVKGARAQLGSVAWSSVQGGIRSVVDQRVLVLSGTAHGQASEMLRIVNASPVGDWLLRSLSRATASGNAELELGLNIPLREPAKAEVKGSVRLAGNDVRISPDSPLLAAAKGRVDFSHKGFAVVGATATAYGGDLAFDGGVQADGALRFNGRGTASVEALRRASELGLLSSVAPQLSGTVAYRIGLNFVQGHPEINVTSDLVGLASDLPAPLRKTAEAALPMHYSTSLVRESLRPGQPLADTLVLELGSLLQVRYRRDISGKAPRVTSGAIGVGEAAPALSQGVVVNVNLGAVNLDAWEAVYRKLFGDAADAAVDDPGYGPDRLSVRAQELITGGRRITSLVAGISRDPGQWRASLDADQLSGYVEYRPPRFAVSRSPAVPSATPSTAVPGRVYARLSRLSLPKSDVEQIESMLDEPPSSVPALDIIVEAFELRGKQLGRVEIVATNQLGSDARASREWRLSKFSMTTPEAQLSASGNWSAGGATARRVEMDFKLDLRDSGAFLERLGLGKVVRGGKGVLAGKVAWLGSPLTLDFAAMSGQFNVAVEAGQFLKVHPGAARLLGVLSLQSLPRRLLLDFRDVFEEGFAFDSFRGDVRVDKGVAHTNNLRMGGVQAVVLMEGSADLGRETQDLRIVVVPEINAGTASLAYAVINPAVGLGTFLAQLFLRRPLSEAGTREFHVTGTWIDPQVERIERNAQAPVPESAPQPR